MDYDNKPIVYDHIAISNLARRERAKVIASAVRQLNAWVARRWASLAYRKGHLPA